MKPLQKSCSKTCIESSSSSTANIGTIISGGDGSGGLHTANRKGVRQTLMTTSCLACVVHPARLPDCLLTYCLASWLAVGWQ